MSIRKWSFLVVCTTICTILLSLNVVTYLLFRTALTQQRLQLQQQSVQSNVRLSEAFTQTVEQLVYQYTSDPQLGQLLGASVGPDSLRDQNIKQGLNARISQLLNGQPLLLNCGFQVRLYVNPQLQVSQLFLPSNTDQNISRVFHGSMVQDQGWYQQTLQTTGGLYVFLSQDGTQLCFSCMLKNSAYIGAHPEQGLGVLLGALPVSQLPDLLALIPSTPNSGVLLMNGEGEMVYCSENLQHLPVEQLQPRADVEDAPITVVGETYLCTWQKLQWGLQLGYLTPYRDITQQVLGVMSPYVICSVAFMVLGILMSLILSNGISRPVVGLTQKLDQIQDIREVTWTGGGGPREIRQLGESFGGLIRCVNDLIQEVTCKEELRRESDLRALQAQINPHFMLNAMNTVNYMALERGEDDIAETVNSIASLMRYSITEPDCMVTVSTELDNIREYISIHTLRFRQKIQLEVLPGLWPEQVTIPKFTLQPLVENSIHHGMTRRDAGIRISIRLREECDRVLLEVTDSGVGADAALLNAYLEHRDVKLSVHHGFGIRNVNERLKLSLGDASGLKYINHNGNSLVAQIIIPRPHQQE